MTRDELDKYAKKNFSLSEEEKKIAEKAKQQFYSDTSKRDALIAETDNLGSNISKTLSTGNGWMDSKSRTKLHSDISNYETNLRRLQNFGLNTDEQLKNVGGMRSVAATRSRISNAYKSAEAYDYALKQYEKQQRLSSMSDDELETEIKRLSDSRDRAKKQSGGKLFNTIGKFFVDDEKYKSAYNSNIRALEDYDREIDLAKREKAERGFAKIDELPVDLQQQLINYVAAANAEDYRIATDAIDPYAQERYREDSLYQQQVDTSEARQRETYAELQRKLTSLGYDADKIIDYARFQYDEAEAGRNRDYYAQLASEFPIIASVASVFASPYKMIGNAARLGDFVSDSELPANANSPYYFANDFVNTARKTVMDNVDWNGKYTNIDWFDQLYSTVMSSGDSLLAGVLGSAIPGGGGAGAIIGLSAMSEGAQNIAAKGGSKIESLITGIINGINEGLFESLSLGQFKALSEKGISKLLSKDGIKTAVTNLLKSAGVNASEEFNTEVANILMDYAFNGSLSDYEQAYEAALAEGVSEEEARKTAAWSMTKQALEAGFGGALQGLLMGGGATANAAVNGGAISTNNFINDIARGRQLKADGAFSAVQEQIGNLDNEKLQKQADKAAQKMADGKKVSARKLGSIQRKAYMESSAQAAAATEEAVTTQLKEYGDANAEKTAKTLVNMFKGKEVDSAALADNEAAQRVISEYFSEEGADWVSDLNNKLVNARNASYKIASGTNEDIASGGYQFPASERQSVINSAEYGAPVNAQMRFDNDISQIKKAQSELAAKADAEMFDTEDMTVDNDNGTEEFAVNVGDNGEISGLYIGGDEVPITEAKLTQRSAELVSGLNYISKELNLDMGTANVVLGEFYNTELSAKDYIKAARLVVRAGQIGNASMLNSELAKTLPENVRNTLYSGAREARINKAAEAQNAVNAKKGKKKGKTAAVTYIDDKGNRVSVENFNDGKALKEIFKGVSDDKIAQIMFLSDVASALGTDITFTNTRGGTKLYNAFYNGKTNSFNINIDAGRVGEEYMTFSASHELTHFIKAWSPAKYNDFADYLVQAYSENGADVEKLIKNKITLSERIHDAEVEKIGKAHPEWNDAEIEAACETYVFNREQAFDEVVADSCESFLLDSNIAERLKELQQQDMSLFDKVCYWLSKFIDNLKKVRDIIKNGNYSARSAEAQLVKSFGAQTEALIKLWENALVDAREASVSTEGAAGNGAVEQFQLREGAKDDIKKAINDKNYTEDVYLTENTPPIILGQKGVKNLPLYMKPSHIRENILTEDEAKSKGFKVNEHTHYHGLGEDLFYKVIDGLNDVEYAFRGTKNADMPERRENYFLLVSKVKMPDGKTINIPVYINEKGQYNRAFVDVNKVATVFARENFSKYIQKEVKKGNLIRIKKRNTQIGELKAIFASSYDKDISKISISNPAENVNSNSKKSFQLTEDDTEYLALAKNPEKNEARLREMVEQAAKAAGYTVKVWHGTQSRFTKFKLPYEELGIHLGTKQQARVFAGRGKNAVMQSNFIKLNNPIRLDEDLGSWYGKNVTIALFEKGILSKEEAESIVFTKDKMYRRSDSAAVVDLRKLLTSKGYDGIIYPNYFEGKTVQDSYIVWDKSAVKSADLVTYDDSGNIIPLSERFNNANEDIRYQYSDYDDFGLLDDEYDAEFDTEGEDAYEKFNEDYTRLESLRELVKAKKPKKSTIIAAANIIEKKYGITTNAAKQEFVKRLEAYYDDINSGATGANAFKTAQDMVAWLFEQRNDLPRDEYAQTILNDLRTRRVSLSAEQKAEVAGTGWDSFGDYRKSLMGSIIISNDGQSMEDLFSDLSNYYPDYFDAAENPIDMPSQLAEIISNLRSSFAAEDTDSAIKMLATDIYDSYWNVTTLNEVGGTVAAKALSEAQRATQKAADLKTDLRSKEKEIAALKREHDKTVEKIQKDYEKRTEKVKERYERAKGRRELTESKQKMRKRITKAVKRVDKLLRHGDKYNHIPEDMRNATVAFLEIFADETDVDGKTIHSGVFELRKLKNLRVAYENLKDTGVTGYSEDVQEMLNTLENKLDGKRLSQLTPAELMDVETIVDNFYKVIKDGNEMFINGKREERSSIVRNMLAQFKAHKPNAALGIIARLPGGNDSKFSLAKAVGSITQNVTPIYYFKNIGGEMQRMWNDFRDGQDNYARYKTQIQDYIADTRKKHNFEKWADQKAKFTFTDNNGEKVELDVQQALTLYATAKREMANDTTEHLLESGITFEDRVNVKTKDGKKSLSFDRNSHQITLDTLTALGKFLTDEQKAYADDMVKFLSTDMADIGNATSMELYNIKLFREQYYFPFNSDKNYLQMRFGEVEQNIIKQASFTHALTKGANNPLVLSSFDEVWANHCNQMALYASVTVPMSNLNSVLNYKISGNAETKTDAVSVRAEFESSYGKPALDYLTTLMTDINGGIRADSREGFANKLVSAFKKNAVFASASVVLQQPSAIGRAFAYIEPRYFAKTLVTKRDYEECKKYNGVAVIKESGSFDTGVGRSAVDDILKRDYDTTADKVKGFFYDKSVGGVKGVLKNSYRDEVLSWAPGKADEITWCHIWNACKAKVRAEQKLTGEAMYQAAAKEFRDVIDYTQVYDSTFARSGLMRSKSLFMKSVTAFMAEPTVSLNMLIDAAQGLNNGKTGVKFFGRALGAFVSSVLINSILKSLATAPRDDDEDETITEKYLGNLVGNFLDELNPLNMIPYIRDIRSIWQGYDVERADMSVISDCVKAVQDIGNDNMSLGQKIEGIAGAAGALTGVPAKNIMRDIRSTINIFKFAKVNGTVATSEGITRSIYEAFGKDVEMNALYAQIVEANGDVNSLAYRTAYQTLIRSGKTDTEAKKAISSGIRKALRENDVRIVNAAAARINGNMTEYTAIAKQMKSEGNYSQDDIVSAISSEVNWFNSKVADAKELENNGESTKAITKELRKKGYSDELIQSKIASYVPEEESEAKHKSLYTRDDIAAAIAESPDMLTDIKKDLVQVNEANGKDNEAATSSAETTIRSAIHDAVDADDISESMASELLSRYGGYDTDTAAKKAAYWVFKKSYPEIGAEMDEDVYAKYLRTVAPSGISVTDYYSYYSRKKGATGIDSDGDGKADTNSVKNEVMAIIDSLPITKEQKDALYFENNSWSPNTLYQAPWH